jgi:hypothetical protein
MKHVFVSFVLAFAAISTTALAEQIPNPNPKIFGSNSTFVRNEFDGSLTIAHPSVVYAGDTRGVELQCNEANEIGFCSLLGMKMVGNNTSQHQIRIPSAITRRTVLQLDNRGKTYGLGDGFCVFTSLSCR